MKNCIENKKEKNSNDFDIVILDVPECLIATSTAEGIWINSNCLPSLTLRSSLAVKAVIRLAVATKSTNSIGISEIFMKPADNHGAVGKDELRVASAFTDRNQSTNISMTIVNLDINQAFSYAFIASEDSLPVFEMYLMGYYV